MNYETICLSSKTIDIAENDLYLELTNRMCYYDDKNLNSVLLPYKGVEEKALECAKSLINMPVQAKYKKIAGEDDLGSHEMHINPDGEIVFDTESIGTHVDVWIEETEVTTVSGEVKKLPCLYAKKRIWKRNKNFINAIKRLYESESGLGSSWEIQTLEYTFKDGVKTLTDYVFLSDCLLGSTTTPAYNGTSKAISLSSLTEQELMVAEALSQDIISQGLDKNNQEKEENILKKDENITLSSEENVEETNTDEVSTNKNTDTENVEESNGTESSEETNKEKDDEDKEDIDNKEDIDDDSECKKKKSSASTETSSLTAFDLRMKINQACREKVRDWCWVSFMFPEEHVVWCEYDEAESELDYLKFTYSVENDDVTVSDPEKVKLSVIPSQINSTVSEYEKTIAEKDDLIVKASSEITSLKSENTELSQYKEKFTQMEQEKMAAELAQKKEDLIASVCKSGQITREEIEASEEFSGYVDNLDKKSLMAIVGERLSASVDGKTENNVETSETKSDVHVASNLNNEDDDVVDKVSIMRNFLRK
ncbi:hypothetical protein FYJ37_00905 [[Clostridium] scindens]|uniref:Uncharacterized protein n=1 Tax=Clostridium scindens (strain JCM 10418 / VPI 12708) TaxID=29347 RepID=A0A844F305_CLOSV|nr:hypothetical protein [[Clostridium] scindens]MSS38943.1 hypothetical protein [[Clostridium] scindens]